MGLEQNISFPTGLRRNLIKGRVASHIQDASITEDGWVESPIERALKKRPAVRRCLPAGLGM